MKTKELTLKQIHSVPCARLCHVSGGEPEQIQFLLGHVSVQTTERYLGCRQQIRPTVDERFGIEPNPGRGPKMMPGRTSGDQHLCGNMHCWRARKRFRCGLNSSPCATTRTPVPAAVAHPQLRIG